MDTHLEFNMHPSRLTLVVVCSLLSLALTSCGSQSASVLTGINPADSNNSAVNSAPAGSTAQRGELAVSSGDDNEPEGPQYQMPSMNNLKGIPQHFPARYVVRKYPKAQVVLVAVRPNLFPGEKNQVMLRSSDPPQVISSFYKTDLSKNGWKLVDSYENSIYSSTKWQKDGQEVEVRVSPDPYNRENIQLLSSPIMQKLTPRQPDVQPQT